MLLSTHSTSSQMCSVWMRYEECIRYGRKTEVAVMFRKQSCKRCEMATYLAACIHLNKKSAPRRPHPDPVTIMSHHKPGFLRSGFIFPLLSHPEQVMAYIASFSCSLLTGVESGIALCCCSPSNSRLNDVCFLKCPSAQCCCTQLSFICGLLT